MVLDGLGSLVFSTVLGASGGLPEDPLRKPDELDVKMRTEAIFTAVTAVHICF